MTSYRVPGVVTFFSSIVFSFPTDRQRVCCVSDLAFALSRRDLESDSDYQPTALRRSRRRTLSERNRRRRRNPKGVEFPLRKRSPCRAISGISLILSKRRLLSVATGAPRRCHRRQDRSASALGPGGDHCEVARSASLSTGFRISFRRWLSDLSVAGAPARPLFNLLRLLRNRSLRSATTNVVLGQEMEKTLEREGIASNASRSSQTGRMES